MEEGHKVPRVDKEVIKYEDLLYTVRAIQNNN